MSALEAKKIGTVNGLDVDALHEVIEEVKSDSQKGIVEFKVKTAWRGQTRSETAVESYKLGGKRSNAASPSMRTNRSSYLVRTPLPIRRSF